MARFLKAFVAFYALIGLFVWIPGAVFLGFYLGGLVAGTIGAVLGGLVLGLLAAALLAASMVSVMGKP